MKAITTLCYLTMGKMGQCSSDDLSLSPPAVTRVVSQTITAFHSLILL